MDYRGDFFKNILFIALKGCLYMADHQMSSLSVLNILYHTYITFQKFGKARGTLDPQGRIKGLLRFRSFFITLQILHVELSNMVCTYNVHANVLCRFFGKIGPQGLIVGVCYFKNILFLAFKGSNHIIDQSMSLLSTLTIT